jgi:hypothetical protein
MTEIKTEAKTGVTLKEGFDRFLEHHSLTGDEVVPYILLVEGDNSFYSTYVNSSFTLRLGILKRALVDLENDYKEEQLNDRH